MEVGPENRKENALAAADEEVCANHSSVVVSNVIPFLPPHPHRLPSFFCREAVEAVGGACGHCEVTEIMSTRFVVCLLLSPASYVTLPNIG